MTADQLEQIRSLVVETRAHCALDMEITIEGNGVNSGEAQRALDGVATILGFDENELEAATQKRMQEIDEAMENGDW